MSHVTAAILLATMAALMLTSIRDDVITMDERSHIGAGYSYLTRADYRLNREHPPLMKDLAAVGLVFRNLKVPWDHPSWTDGNQWDFGGTLLYESGQNPDRVTRAARIPMILFTLGLGGAIYWWTGRRFGGGAGLIALALYTFSPTFLAHGRLVTTDVGAAAGILFGTLCYVRFLRSPTFQNALFAGLVMGLAFLAKFSTSLLVVTTVALTVIWVMAVERPEGQFKVWCRYMALAGCVLAIASVVVYVVYLHHTWNYPRRAEDVMDASSRAPGVSLKALAAWAVDTRVLRPWGHFLVGLERALGRVREGQRPFFLGVYRKSSTASYFPVLYLVKEPLALHVLTLVALLFVPSGAPVVHRLLQRDCGWSGRRSGVGGRFELGLGSGSEEAGQVRGRAGNREHSPALLGVGCCS